MASCQRHAVPATNQAVSFPTLSQGQNPPCLHICRHGFASLLLPILPFLHKASSLAFQNSLGVSISSMSHAR